MSSVNSTGTTMKGYNSTRPQNCSVYGPYASCGKKWLEIIAAWNKYGLV